MSKTATIRTRIADVVIEEKSYKMACPRCDGPLDIVLNQEGKPTDSLMFNCGKCGFYALQSPEARS